jgi:hypothetical protein
MNLTREDLELWKQLSAAGDRGGNREIHAALVRPAEPWPLRRINLLYFALAQVERHHIRRCNAADHFDVIAAYVRTLFYKLPRRLLQWMSNHEVSWRQIRVRSFDPKHPSVCRRIVCHRFCVSRDQTMVHLTAKEPRHPHPNVSAKRSSVVGLQSWWRGYCLGAGTDPRSPYRPCAATVPLGRLCLDIS